MFDFYGVLVYIKEVRLVLWLLELEKTQSFIKKSFFIGIVKRITLRSKDLNQKISIYKIEFSKKDLIESVDDGKYQIIYVNKKQAFFYHQDKIIPTLRFLRENELLKKVVVDLGAIKFVVNGADIMRPGIVSLDEDISKGEIVVIEDQNHHKALAVGEALLSGTEMKTMVSGKVIKNIHHVGDELWDKNI